MLQISFAGGAASRCVPHLVLMNDALLSLLVPGRLAGIDWAIFSANRALLCVGADRSGDRCSLSAARSGPGGSVWGAARVSDGTGAGRLPLPVAGHVGSLRTAALCPRSPDEAPRWCTVPGRENPPPDPPGRGDSGGRLLAPVSPMRCSATVGLWATRGGQLGMLNIHAAFCA